MLVNGPGDLGSIPGRVIPKTQKMAIDASSLNTQRDKVWIKGKIDQSSVVVIENGAFWSPSTMIGQLIYILIYI